MMIFALQIYALLLAIYVLKYFYMSRTQRHIKSHYNIISEESYGLLQKPTNAAFITKETMETNAETESIRQEDKVVYHESALAKN